MAGSSSNGLDAIRAAVEELSARKDIAPPPYFAKALKKAQRTSQGFVEPYKALHLIKAVVSRHALVFEQLLAILQVWPPRPLAGR